MSLAPRNWIILGNKSNRRVQFFQSALHKSGEQAASIVSYEEFILNPLSLTQQLTDQTILRIESPGEDARVEQLLIHRGAELHPELDPQKIRSQNIQHGQIFYPDLFYSGFRSVLKSLPEMPSIASISASNNPRVFNTVNDIVTMFDKSLCHQNLHSYGIHLPTALYHIDSFEQLISAMEAHHLSRVFVKLRHSSSASGCIALAINPKHNKIVAYSTIEMLNSGKDILLFNSLKPKQYRDLSTIKSIIDTLAQYELHIEQWVPKGVINGYTYDLRLVLIGQSVKHQIARVSKHPITNLHLGNLRKDVTELALSTDKRQAIDALALEVSRCFKDSAYMGIDIALPDNSKPVLIEVNAFGDLLPDLKHQSLTTYEAEVNYVQRKLNCLH